MRTGMHSRAYTPRRMHGAYPHCTAATVRPAAAIALPCLAARGPFVPQMNELSHTARAGLRPPVAFPMMISTPSVQRDGRRLYESHAHVLYSSEYLVGDPREIAVLKPRCAYCGQPGSVGGAMGGSLRQFAAVTWDSHDYEFLERAVEVQQHYGVLCRARYSRVLRD